MVDYIDEIVNRIPVVARQFGAGVATIPSEIANFGTMVANPNRTIRAFRGQAIPEDAQGAIPAIERVSQGWNNTVNDALNIEQPSAQDDTLNAAARFLGGAAITVPTGGMGSAPLAARALGRLAEVVTPLTFTGKTSAAGRAIAVGANTVVPTAAATAVEHLTEERDPTETVKEYDLDGNLLATHYPAIGAEPGAGRIAARAVGAAIEDSPITTAAGAGALGVAALLAGGRARSAARIRDASELSNVVRAIPEKGQVEVELPGATALTRQTEVLQDANITRKEAVRQALPADPERARAVNAMNDLVTEQAHKGRVQRLREDGIIETPEGRVETVALNRLAEELTHASRNNPDLKRRVDDHLTVESELDNRRAHQEVIDVLRHRGWTDERIADKTNHLVAVDSTRPRLDPTSGLQIVENGKPAFEKDYIVPRATLHHLDTADIQRQVDTGRLDPEVTSYATRYWKAHNDTLDALVKFGALGQNERNLMRQANPHYRHTNNLEESKSPFTTRLRGHEEGPQYGGDVWDASREYMDHALDFAYRNMAKREAIESIVEAQRGGLPVGKLIGKVSDPRQIRLATVGNTLTGGRPMTKADIKLTGNVSRYKVGGDLVEVEVHNKSLHHSLENMPRHATTMFGWMKGVAESAMTGKIATLMGQPFALANATMGAIYGLMVRPKSLPLGIFDRGMMNLTGGRFGVRGDVTAYGGMAATAAKNVGLVMGKAFSDALKNSIAASGMLAKLPGANALADRLATVWRESHYAHQRGTGSGDVITLGGQGLDTSRRSGVIDGMEHTEQVRIVDPTKPDTFGRYLQTFGKNVVPADAKVAWRVINEIQQAISTAPQSYAYGTNLGRRTKGMTDAQAFMEVQKLSAEVRQLLGDPAMRGSGLRDFQRPGASKYEQAVGRTLDATPYGNISVQALARLMRAFREDFVGTSAGVGATMGVVSILPIIHAYDLDKERMAQGLPPVHIPNELSREHWHASRYIRVHMRGVEPRLSVDIRADPISALFQTAMREAVWWYLGIAGNRTFEPNADIDQSMEGLREYARGRTLSNIGNAALNSTPISQFPPVVGALAAAAGVEVGGMWDVVGRGGATLINERGLGGYDRTQLQGGVVSKRFEAVMQAIAPGLGAVLGGMLTQGVMGERAKPGSFVSSAIDDARGRAIDRFAEARPLFGQAQRRSTATHAAEATRVREQTFNAIRENSASLNGEGSIGSGRRREWGAEGGGRAGVADPQMRNLLGLLNTVWTRPAIAEQVAQRLTERERLLSIKQTGNDYATRRRRENEIAEGIENINQRLLTQYMRVEQEASKLFGRRIRLDRLDPSQPITQFPLME